eukprot:1583855-Rhodomonas_salina.2
MFDVGEGLDVQRVVLAVRDGEEFDNLEDEERDMPNHSQHSHRHAEGPGRCVLESVERLGGPFNGREENQNANCVSTPSAKSLTGNASCRGAGMGISGRSCILACPNVGLCGAVGAQGPGEVQG